jgi:hypothetical protein
LRKPRRKLLAALGAAIGGLVVVSAALFVWPPTNRPQHVDAILSLNGRDERSRESTAISMAEHGYASVLLFSQGNYRTTPCPTVHRVTVVCFEPVPARTVGEVEWASRYARRHGLHSLMVVATRPQTLRARLLMDRCFAGRVVVVSASVPVLQLPYDVIYQWGALGKALTVDRSC